MVALTDIFGNQLRLWDGYAEPPTGLDAETDSAGEGARVGEGVEMGENDVYEIFSLGTYNEKYQKFFHYRLILFIFLIIK